MLLMQELQSQRTDAAFDKFYHSGLSDSEGKTDHPTLPRQRRAPKRWIMGLNQPISSR